MKKNQNNFHTPKEKFHASHNKFTFFFGIFLCTALLISQFFLPLSQNKIAVQSNSYHLSSPFTVIIDPGHGGRDPGKVGTDKTLEKDINLEIALYLKEILETQDIKVIMTRCEDKDLATTASNFKVADMKERINLMKNSNADLVVCIHQNSYTHPDVYGAQCFYHSNSEESQKLASILQKQIINSTNQTKIREIKSNNDYYLLKHSPLPTVIVECGFLSNPEEEKLLSSKEYQRKMAWAIHLGILKYLKRSLY